MAYHPDLDFVMPDAADDTLIDLLDRLLDHGVVLSGDLRIGVAGVDLIHVGLKLLLASVDTADRFAIGEPRAQGRLA